MPCRSHSAPVRNNTAYSRAAGGSRAVCPISTRCLLNHHSSLQVTPAVFSDMKRQLKQREDGGWARVQWDIVRVSGRGGAPSP